MSNIKIMSSGNNMSLPENSISSATIYRDHIDVVTPSVNRLNKSPLSRYRRHSKYEYIDTETGEILKYKIGNNKSDNTDSIRRSLKDIRSLILNNFVEEKGFYITLTYSYRMDDFCKANDDFRVFIDKFKYRMDDVKIEYLKIIEAQESGSWHFHILIKSSNYKYFRMTKGKVEDCWKHGSVNIKQIYDVNGLASYLGTYCGSNGTNGYKTKMQKKSERWKHYPPGARIFSKSAGIVYPKKEIMKRGELLKILNGSEKLSENDVIVIDEVKGQTLNRIKYETFANTTNFSI